jgi:hypothetical protein
MQEDEKVRHLVGVYGAKKWTMIATELPDRIGKECRERWHNHLREKSTDRKPRVLKTTSAAAAKKAHKAAAASATSFPPTSAQDHVAYEQEGSSEEEDLEDDEYSSILDTSTVSNILFHRGGGTAPVTNWQEGTANQIAITRGGAFVAFNRGSSSWKTTLQTGLPAGEYCHVVDSLGNVNPATCTSTVTVNSDGTASMEVRSLYAVALHTGAKK